MLKLLTATVIGAASANTDESTPTIIGYGPGSTNKAGAMSFDDAQSYCENLGGEVPSPEQAILYSDEVNTAKEGHCCYWTNKKVTSDTGFTGKEDAAFSFDAYEELAKSHGVDFDTRDFQHGGVQSPEGNTEMCLNFDDRATQFRYMPCYHTRSVMCVFTPGSRGEFVKDTKGDLSDVFFNEIHYDNAKKLNSDGELTSALRDVGEGYEIAGKAGTDLEDYYVVHYNGRNGMKYGSNKVLDGKLVDKKCGWGFKWFNAPGLQNGAPDGIALVRQHGTRDRSNTPIKDDEVIQFLSYEGTFTAKDGPAEGMLSTEINVNQQNPKGIKEHTMQLVGSYPNFKWEENIAKTHDLVNTGQEFCTATPTPTERCDANNCMSWSCADWCECYDESKLDIYSSYPECQDDNDDTCICFDNEEHDLNGERHRKINYNQDAVDAGVHELIEGTNIHTATKQHHYQEAAPVDPVQFVGCYNQNQIPGWSDWSCAANADTFYVNCNRLHGSHDAMVEECANTCRSRGATQFDIHDRTACFCGTANNVASVSPPITDLYDPGCMNYLYRLN